jgi:uncharacterized protein involved in type VI secretion and phage assembly
MALPEPDDGAGPRYFGVYPAIVTNIVDDERKGRIELRFPTFGTDGDRDVRAWATVCSPYADADQGLQIIPEVGSQVVVGFEGGNLRRPYVLGAAWHGAAKQPRSPESANNVRVLRSREHSEIEFDDTPGGEKISITTQRGHRVVLDSGAMSITIRHLSGSEITLDALGQIQIHANLKVDVTAPLVNVTAPMSTFTGVVKCQTLISDAFVISPAYTPGVGNLL